MLMSDTRISDLIASGVLSDATEANIGPVSYDLRTKCFYADGDELSEVELEPGDSVFVGSIETVRLPGDVAVRVMLKNSRIRQGLSLDAPLYFPGHATRLFFRVTNVSADIIRLDTRKGIAQATFETVDEVSHPYEGAFSDEFDFSGLATYEGACSAQIKKLDKKKDELKGMESRIYGNVMTLFALFAAIFTFVNVNAGALSGESTVSSVIVVDLMVLGGVHASRWRHGFGLVCPSRATPQMVGGRNRNRHDRSFRRGLLGLLGYEPNIAIAPLRRGFFVLRNIGIALVYV